MSWLAKTSSPNIKKFTFDKVFVTEKEELLPKKNYLYTDEDLKCAKVIGDSEGYNRGVQETREGMIRQSADEIQRRLGDILAAQKSNEMLAHQSVARLAIDLLNTLMPFSLKSNALQEVQGVIDQAFADVDISKMTIFVHPDLVAPLNQQLKALPTERYSGLDFQIQPAPLYDHFDLSDCRIEWHGGGLERREKRLKEEILKVLGRLEAHENSSASSDVSAENI